MVRQDVIDAIDRCRQRATGDGTPDAVGVNPLERVHMLPTSRYRETLIYSELGPAFGRFSHRAADIEPDVTDDFHQVLPGESFRLDLIAYQHYGTPRLWWVLALANDITNPFTAPYVGDTLRVPSVDRLIARVLRV